MSSPGNAENHTEVSRGHAALRMILEGTASETGERFFMALVENLARTLGPYSAWVTEYLPQPRRLRALAFWVGGDWVEGYEHVIDGTPCQVVVEGKRGGLRPT